MKQKIRTWVSLLASILLTPCAANAFGVGAQTASASFYSSALNTYIDLDAAHPSFSTTNLSVSLDPGGSLTIVVGSDGPDCHATLSVRRSVTFTTGDNTNWAECLGHQSANISGSGNMATFLSDTYHSGPGTFSATAHVSGHWNSGGCFEEGPFADPTQYFYNDISFDLYSTHSGCGAQLTIALDGPTSLHDTYPYIAPNGGAPLFDPLAPVINLDAHDPDDGTAPGAGIQSINWNYVVRGGDGVLLTSGSAQTSSTQLDLSSLPQMLAGTGAPAECLTYEIEFGVEVVDNEGNHSCQDGLTAHANGSHSGTASLRLNSGHAWVSISYPGETSYSLGLYWSQWPPLNQTGEQVSPGGYGLFLNGILGNDDDSHNSFMVEASTAITHSEYVALKARLLNDEKHYLFYDLILRNCLDYSLTVLQPLDPAAIGTLRTIATATGGWRSPGLLAQGLLSVVGSGRTGPCIGRFGVVSNLPTNTTTRPHETAMLTGGRDFGTEVLVDSLTRNAAIVAQSFGMAFTDQQIATTVRPISDDSIAIALTSTDPGGIMGLLVVERAGSRQVAAGRAGTVLHFTAVPGDTVIGTWFSQGGVGRHRWRVVASGDSAIVQLGAATTYSYVNPVSRPALDSLDYLQVPNSSRDISLTLGPNPVRTDRRLLLMWRGAADAPRNIEVYDVAGRLLMRRPLIASAEAGSVAVTLDSSIRTGFYFVRALTAGGFAAWHIVVIN